MLVTRIIAFCGPKGSGKDTSANYLLARNTTVREGLFKKVNFADTLKDACSSIFGITRTSMEDPRLKEEELHQWPGLSPRSILQQVANHFRDQYTPDIWVRAWKAKVPWVQAECIVVTDLRHIEELIVLREMGAKVFYIFNAEVELRRSEGIAAGDPLWTNTSEAFTPQLMKEADVVITSPMGSISKLHSLVHNATLEHVGDFNNWG